MNPKISVIIPVYNGGEQIKPCIEALQAQTLKEIEFICVLDCPTDGSDKIIESFAEQDKRIKVIKNSTNLNIGESRNRGIEAATGDYIGFSDHDDYADPTMYEKLYDAITKEHVHVAMCERGDFFKTQNVKEKRIDNQMSYTVWSCLQKTIANRPNLNTVYVWNKIYDRAFIQENSIRFPDNKSYPAGEDILFNFYVFKKLSELKREEKVAYVGEALYWHIFHGDNTSNRVWKFDYICRYNNLITEEIEKSRFLSCDAETVQNAYFGFLSTISSGLYWANKEKKVMGLKQLFGIKSYSSLRTFLKRNWSFYNQKMSLSKNILAWLVKVFA